MATWTYPAAAPPLLRLSRCSGAVSIEAWDEPAVEISGAIDEEVLQQTTVQRGAEIQITACAADLRLRVPRTARLEAAQQHGSLAMQGIAAVRLHAIAGDVVLRSIAGDAQLEDIRGDLLVEGVEHVVGRGAIDGDARLAAVGELELEQVGGALRVEATPALQVGSVGGSVLAAGASERCRLGRIGGDLTLRECGMAELAQLGGSLESEGVRGLQSGDIGGSARIAIQPRGSVELGSIGGDLNARIAGGALRVARVGGDALVDGADAGMRLGSVAGDLEARLRPTGDQEYSGNVGGDALLQLAEDAGLVLQAVVGGTFAAQTPGGPRRVRHGPVKMTFGAGGARLKLVVGGDLLVRDASGDVSFEDGVGVEQFAEELADFGQEMAEMGRQFAASFGAGFAPWGARGRGRRRQGRPPSPPLHLDHTDVGRIKEIARQAAQGGIAQAQEAVERALGEMWRRASGSDAPARAQAGPATGPTVDLSREPQPERASDEERLAILRMLQEGRITPDEAEQLLAALDG